MNNLKPKMMQTIEELTRKYWNIDDNAESMKCSDIGYLSGNDLCEYARYIITKLNNDKKYHPSPETIEPEKEKFCPTCGTILKKAGNYYCPNSKCCYVDV
jgi:hypothetical protein